MKNKLFFIFIFLIFTLLILTFFVNITIANDNSNKVDFNVLNELQKEENVGVIIEAKGDINKTIDSIENILDENLGKEDVYNKYIYAEVNQEELDKLKDNNKIQSIIKNHEISAFLQQSTGLVNSTLTNSIKISGINLTGTGNTICIIDTGINFSHPDLLGKNKSCIVDCYNKLCVQDCSLGDDNGHGTHVAGIAGASGNIFGIATNISLIGVKILDSGGGGSGNDLDLSRAIDYCVSQNVSVISMSLGTSSLYNSDCAGSMGSWTTSVDAAFAKNISVIAASGNNGNYTHIASPACIANVTPVGDVYDSDVGSKSWSSGCTDSSTYADKIVCHSNRNSLVQLFAPGAVINSTYNNGLYQQLSGTSMATPMVAGAFAIIQQFLNLTGQTRTPLQIESTLNSTGRQINDSGYSNLNYSSIDIYNAIKSLDYFNPNISLDSPTNASSQINQNVSFTCSAYDVQLRNLTLFIYNSTGILNSTNTINSSNTSVTYNINSILGIGTYKWNCLAYDHRLNSSFSSNNNTITVSEIQSTLNTLNNSYANQNKSFNCTAQTDSSFTLTNTSLYIWNSSNSLVYNNTNNLSGIINSSIFSHNLSNEGIYKWNCKSYNSRSNFSFAENNFTITYDITKPTITILNPSDSSSYNSNSQSIAFSYNVSDNYNVSNCSLIVNSAVSLTNTSINNSNNNSITQSFSAGTYNWNINCTDSALNENNSNTRSFTVTAPVAGSSSGSGGGGGGGGGSVASTGTTYVTTAEQTSTGYTQELKKDDKIKFFDEKGEQHLVNLTNLQSDRVILVVQSDPIVLTLAVGQSAKLNLTNSNLYDLFIKLESITNDKAKLTIQTINEPIIQTKNKSSIEEPNSQLNNQNGQNTNELASLGVEISKLKYITYTFIIIFIIVIAFIIFRYIIKGKKKDIKEHKNIFNRFLRPKNKK